MFKFQVQTLGSELQHHALLATRSGYCQSLSPSTVEPYSLLFQRESQISELITYTNATI